MNKSKYNFHTSSSRAKNSGVSLIIALFSLVALTIAALALIRSVSVTNTVAGNLSFRQANIHASDIGVENALNALSTIVSTSIDSPYPATCTAGGCNYYPTRQSIDSTGIPNVINWSNVPAITVDASYSVQFVIDRQCDGPVPVTDISSNCMNTMNPTAGSKKAGAISFTSADQVYYRATIRVVGPRDTRSFIQTIFAK